MRKSPNHYRVLGIAPSATLDEVKEAYRKLALSTHPDAVGCGREDDFRSIQEAYEVLSDPDRRSRYDESRRFLHLHSGGVQQTPSPGRRRRTGRNSGYQLEIILSPEEALWGLQLRIPFRFRTYCTYCRGFGVFFEGFCQHCGGRGLRDWCQDVIADIPPGVCDGDILLLGIPSASARTDEIECRIRILNSDIA